MTILVIDKSLGAAMRRRKLSRPCSFCGHDYLQHGIGDHALKDEQKSGGMCIQCQHGCKQFVRVEEVKKDAQV